VLVYRSTRCPYLLGGDYLRPLRSPAAMSYGCIVVTLDCMVPLG